jgi:hypothetical protein
MGACFTIQPEYKRDPAEVNLVSLRPDVGEPDALPGIVRANDPSPDLPSVHLEDAQGGRARQDLVGTGDRKLLRAVHSTTHHHKAQAHLPVLAHDVAHDFKPASPDVEAKTSKPGLGQRRISDEHRYGHSFVRWHRLRGL